MTSLNERQTIKVGSRKSEVSLKVYILMRIVKLLRHLHVFNLSLFLTFLF